MMIEPEPESLYRLMCGRCYDEVDEVFAATCPERPELLTDLPLGQYHCPDCGAMLIASLPHPDVCARCLTHSHPDFDGTL